MLVVLLINFDRSGFRLVAGLKSSKRWVLAAVAARYEPSDIVGGSGVGFLARTEA